MSKRWFSTDFLKAAPVGDVNAEKGVIEGVSVCTAGEAKGHGVNLDSEFIGRVKDLGNEKGQGLKARFGHPNMCSTALGTFIGRFKHFRTDAGSNQVRADLYLSNEAKDTPHGNLHDYVTGMAANEPDMFGTSIVFTPGRAYKRAADGKKIFEPGWPPGGDETQDEHNKRRDEWDQCAGPIYVECEALHACDAVDEPAANDGMFSRFSQETIAGQITEFLDLNPHVFKAIERNPSIVEALARYGDKVDEFITRYREYREHNGEGQQMTSKATSPDGTAGNVKEPSATVTPEEQAKLDAAAEAERLEKEQADKEAADAAKELADAEAEVARLKAGDAPAAALTREEFTKIADEFGAEIATKTVRDGGDYSTALRAYADGLKADNDKLRERVAELEAIKVGGTPAKVAAVKKSAELFKTEEGKKK